MAIKGGYKIIDLKGVDVTQNTMMIKGIYESIESNYGKPLLISGIVINGVEKDDVFVQATLNGSAYEFEVYGYKIQVQDTDAVGLLNKYWLNVRYRGQLVNSTIIEYNSNEERIGDYLIIQQAVGDYFVKKFKTNVYEYILGTYVLGSGANIIISTKVSRTSAGPSYFNNLTFSSCKDNSFSNGGIVDSTTINMTDVTIELMRI